MNAQRAKEVRRDDDCRVDAMKAIERKNNAGARLARSTVLGFDLAKIVAAKEKAGSGGGRDIDEITLPPAGHCRQGRILLQKKIHLALETSCKTLSFAAEGIAFPTDVMKNAVGKCKEERNGF